MGPALTNDLCGQYVKVKVKTAFVLILNIPTAFIRLGRAGPDRGRVPSILLSRGSVDYLWIRLINLNY